jgi:hypothetical protein
MDELRGVDGWVGEISCAASTGMSQGLRMVEIDNRCLRVHTDISLAPASFHWNLRSSKIVLRVMRASQAFW